MSTQTGPARHDKALVPPDHRPKQPHDGLIRSALESLDNARTAIAAALPRDLVAHLDLSRMRPAPARIVDALLDVRESDALWELPFADTRRSLMVHVVAEAQSTSDVDTALRTLGVQVRLWELQRRLGERLTPVIPLVISHGATWRAPRSMLARLRLPRDVEALMAPFTPTSTYVLEDLARFDPAALAARADLTVQLRVTYFLLQRSRSAKALEDELTLIVDDLRALSLDPAVHAFLTRLLRYTYHTANGDMDAVHRVLHTTLTPTMESHMGTLAEQLIARGVQQGLAEGVKTGRVEGALAGQREMLARMLALKFGELSRAARARIEGASHDELATYSLRVLTADTIDAVFA